MKALAFPWFVVKVRPLCTRGSLKAVEAGKPDRALMVRQVWAGSGLCSRSARSVAAVEIYKAHLFWLRISLCMTKTCICIDKPV